MPMGDFWDLCLCIFALIPIIQRESNLLTSDSEYFFWTLRKLLVFAREGSSMARGRSVPPLFSHSPQCRTTLPRERDNKGVGRKRTSGITNASDKAHHVQDTGVKGHGSFTIIVSRSSTFPQLSSPFRLLFLDAFGARPAPPPPPPQFSRVQAMYTRGNNKRNGTERRRQMTRGSCSLDRSHVTSSETVDTVYPVLVEWVTLECPFPLPPCPPSFSRTLFEPVPRRMLPLHLRSTLPSSFNLFSRVACSRSPFSFSLSFSLPCPAGAMSNTRINHAQTFPRSGHARR